MREITTTVYMFDELSEKAKEKAREWYREGALDREWWSYLYDEAKELGLKITESDTSRRYAKGRLTEDAVLVAKKITEEHGSDCETYKTAANFLHWLGKINENDENYEDKKEILETDFEHDLLEDYASLLQQEYEWLLSDEQVDESIRVNEYEFLESGKRI